jgi:hypothetical protein
MLFDDLIDIFLIHVGIPDIFRIHDDNGTFVASVEATRVVNSYPPAFTIQFECFDTGLGVVSHGLCTEIITALFTGFSLVHAEKYMLLVVAHINTREWKSNNYIEIEAELLAVQVPAGYAGGREQMGQIQRKPASSQLYFGP